MHKIIAVINQTRTNFKPKKRARTRLKVIGLNRSLNLQSKISQAKKGGTNRI
jgi:hypothetical protein